MESKHTPITYERLAAFGELLMKHRPDFRFDINSHQWILKAADEHASALLEENERLKAKQPFLGWTNDKDVLNQQREYWGAMNGISELRAEVDRLLKEKTETMDTLLSKIEQRMIDNGVQEVRRDMSIAELAIREESRWMASIIKDLFSPA